MKRNHILIIILTLLASCRAATKGTQKGGLEPVVTVSTAAVSALSTSTNNVTAVFLSTAATRMSMSMSSTFTVLNSTGHASAIPVAGALRVSTPIVLIPVKNKSFKAGEKFTFTLRYQFIESGQATLEIKDGPSVNGRPTYQFVSTAKSNGFADVFYKVRDTNESLVDADSLASVRFFQDLQEGNFKIRRTMTYDHATAQYRYIREHKGRTTVQEAHITDAASDVLSCFFYFRSMALEPGHEYKIPVYSGFRTDMIKVVVGPKIETVKVPAGKFECVKVQPFMNGDAIFKAKEGHMYIWLTHDKRKMPVMIRSKVMIGSFEAVLSQSEFPPN